MSDDTTVVRRASDVWEQDGKKYVRCACGVAQQMGSFTSRYVGALRVGGTCSACQASIIIEPTGPVA